MPCHSAVERIGVDINVAVDGHGAAEQIHSDIGAFDTYVAQDAQVTGR